MLDASGVQKILDDFAALKALKGGGGKDAKKAASADKAGKIEARKGALEKKSAGDKVFIQNASCDLNNHENNDSKPYYVVTFTKLDGANLVCNLFEEELKDCKVADLKKKDFSIGVEQTEEYSKMSEAGIDDMVDIDELNPATLLFNMAQLYKRYDIFVYVGPILLVMNPFKALPALATAELKAKYMEICTCPNPNTLRKELRPHTWAISATAYRTLKDTAQRQAIVISGESGAGKTESAKVAMNFLTDLGKGGGGGGDSATDNIGDKILACNPVLEGFGNAKTVRNNNSSRFGKYTLMYFGLRVNKVYGARIKNYLLEKSRVITVAAQERGYHVFYFLLRGATDEQIKKLLLTDKSGKRMEPKGFNYLKDGGDLEDAMAHDVGGWKEIIETIQQLGFTPEQQDGIWRGCAAVLLFGQLEYDDKSFAKIEDSKPEPGKFKNPEVCDQICDLMGCKDKDYFKKILMHKRLRMKGQPDQWIPITMKKAKDNKDAIAKQLFNNMFDWLVIMMNKTIEPADWKEESFKNEAKTIGLLDIFGFENFKFNNYEQMCINYVNEKLHKLYIAAIFEAECVELKEEGLGHMVDSIQYPDLKVLEILRLLDFKKGGRKYAGIKFAADPPPGIFTTADDNCTQALNGREIKWEDVALTLEKSHGKNVKLYVLNKKVKSEFTINHSAQSVKYDMKEFVQRNIDVVDDWYVDWINDMCDVEIQCMWFMIASLEEKEDAGAKKLKTIWQKFDKQMDDLMDELAETKLQMGEEKQKAIPEGAEDCKLHFVRCIKPRPKPLSKDDRPGMFVHSMTLQQITYMGVMESVALKQKNFPFRKKFEDFYAEYEILSPRYAQVRYYQMNKAAENFQELSTNIVKESMQGLGAEFYAIGNTKVLMMPETKAVLDENVKRASKTYNIKAEVLKKAYCLLMAPSLIARKAKACNVVQCQYKLKYHKRQKKWAEQFRLGFEKALVDFKAEKRKAFEQKAGAAIVSVINKHTFRNKLAIALRARQTCKSLVASTAYINRLQKHLFAHMLATRVVSNAFKDARQRIDGKSAWEIQRAFRGYLARNQDTKTAALIKEAITQKEDLKLQVSAKKVQKRLRGIIVRRKIHYFKLAASTIQSYFRMKIHRDLFLMIKRNAQVIQRCVRRFLARRDQIKSRMRDFLMQEFQIMNNVRDMENVQLDIANPDYIKNHTPYSLKKICVFTRVADMHVISDVQEMHGTPWAGQWMQLFKESLDADNPIMSLKVGTTHSLACTGKGKTYAWGWNDNGQCARDFQRCDEVIIRQSSKVAQVNYRLPVNAQDQTGQVKPKQILAVEDRNLVLVQDTQDLIVWGANEKGQLGLGHYTDVWQPTKVDFFSNQKLKVNSIASGGNLTLATTDNGRAYAWPFVKSGQKYSVPVEMPFHQKIAISRVSCGYNFGFFLSSQGLVYAVGKDNSDGQLGLGHRYPNDIPEIVACFKDAGERIDTIECGFRHAAARSTLGKIYTWGWNGHGQLGHGGFDSELSPRALIPQNTQKRDKVIQIACGFSHTVVMVESNREMYWFGTSGSLQKQSTPIPLDLSEKLPGIFRDKQSSFSSTSGQQIDFAVVKLECTWSKSISLTNLTIADLRPVNKEHKFTKITTVLNSLSQKWDQRDVMPPYNDTHAGLFGSNVMRKPANFQPVNKKGGGAIGAAATLKK